MHTVLLRKKKQDEKKCHLKMSPPIFIFQFDMFHKMIFFFIPSCELFLFCLLFSFQKNQLKNPDSDWKNCIFYTVASNRDIHIRNELTKMNTNLCSGVLGQYKIGFLKILHNVVHFYSMKFVVFSKVKKKFTL